jgi:hypothetical protein
MVFKTIPRDRVILQVELHSETSENCYSMETDRKLEVRRKLT